MASIHALPINVLPEYFVRMLACLELPNLALKDLPIPEHHTELIEKVVQHRSNAADASAGQPADIRASDIKDTLQAFADDPYSAYAKKRWLWNVLKVPKEKRQDPDYLPQLFETAVNEFLEELHAHVRSDLPRSKHTLAVLALYYGILIAWKKKNTDPMRLGPVFRMLANAEGSSRKQYLPQEQCGEDVVLAANRMPAYWTRMKNSAEQPVDAQPVDELSLPVLRWSHSRLLFLHSFFSAPPGTAKTADADLKCVIMVPDELILRLAGALWLRNICKIGPDHKKMD